MKACALLTMTLCVALLASSKCALAEEFVGLVCASGNGGYQQAAVARDGSTLVSSYAWPEFVTSSWSPGVNVFVSANVGAGEAIVFASGPIALSNVGSVYVFHGLSDWRLLENIPASAGVPSTSPFVAYLPSSYLFSGPSLFAYALTSGGAIYQNRTVPGSSGEPLGWRLVRPDDLPTESMQSTFGQVKMRFK